MKYDLGIIPCTKTKNVNGQTARTLYTGGPFSLFIRHAQQRCTRVVIMSAKYGILQLDHAVNYYDATMATLTIEQRAELLVKLREQLQRYVGLRTLAYVPKVYYEIALEALPPVVGGWDRPYKTMPMLPLWARLKKEIADHEAENPASGRLLVPVLPRRGFAPDFDESE